MECFSKTLWISSPVEIADVLPKFVKQTRSLVSNLSGARATTTSVAARSRTECSCERAWLRAFFSPGLSQLGGQRGRGAGMAVHVRGCNNTVGKEARARNLEKAKEKHNNVRTNEL